MSTPLPTKYDENTGVAGVGAFLALGLIKVGLESCVPMVVKQCPLTQWFHRLHSGCGCYFYVVVLCVCKVVVCYLLYGGGPLLKLA